MPKYKLKRRFYDGERMYEVDSLVDFAEGMQPKTAVLMRAKETPKVVEELEEVEFDLDDGNSAAIENAQPGDTLSSLAKKGK